MARDKSDQHTDDDNDRKDTDKGKDDKQQDTIFGRPSEYWYNSGYRDRRQS